MTKNITYGAIAILGRGSDESDLGYIVIEKKESSGERTRLAIPERNLLTATSSTIGKVFYEAFQTTLPQEHNKELVEYLNKLGQSSPTIPVLTKLGWNADYTAFLKPGAVIPKTFRVAVSAEAVSGDVARKFVARGSVENWNEAVCKLVSGNSRLILGIALAFVGPVLDLLDEEQFIVAIYGSPGEGKTTIGAVASTIWGAHPTHSVAMTIGAGETFKETINALDDEYAGHSACFLFIDELSRFFTGSNRTARALPDLVQNHADGKTKKRWNDPTPIKNWSVPVLVTTNESLAHLSPHLGINVRDAIRHRYIEIPAPDDAYGMYENIHGEESIRDFVVKLKTGAISNAGSPAEQFLRMLAKRIAAIGVEPLKCELKTWIDAFLAASRNIKCHERLRRRFAVMYAAARAAKAARVLPFEHEEIQAALLTCLHDHLRFVRGEDAPPAELIDVVRAIRRHYQKHLKNMPDVTQPCLQKQKHKPEACPGYLKSDRKGVVELLISQEAFEKALAGIAAPLDAKRLLASAGLIESQRQGPQARQSVKRVIGQLPDGQPWRISVLVIKLDDLLSQAG